MNAKTISELRNLFQNFDKDKNGFMDQNEFKQFLASLGMELNDDEIKEAFSIFDVNNDGKIDINEFYKVITQ